VLNGATWMVIAAAACAALFPPAVAAAALTIQMLGDAAAAVIGRRFGAHRWPGSAKSVEGSLAFVGAALAGGIAVAAWPGASLAPGALVAGALVGAVAEGLPLGVNDNLRVPLLAGVALLLAG
jgi:dolichol kinase